MYVAAADLADRPGPLEVAQLASPSEHRPVDPELMRLTLVGGVRTQYPANEVAVADAAMARVASACDEANELIDSYLRARYALPLDPVPTVLKHMGRRLARYFLHEHLLRGESNEHPAVQQFNAATAFLKSLSRGEVTLGVADPTAPAPSGSHVQVVAAKPVFSAEALADFTGRL